MKFLFCPYCNREAASYFSLSNIFYLLKSDKRCDNCQKPISIDLKSVVIFFFIICPLTIVVFGGLWLSIHIIATNYIAEDIRQILSVLFIGLFFIFAILMNCFLVTLANKFFKISMFTKRI